MVKRILGSAAAALLAALFACTPGSGPTGDSTPPLVSSINDVSVRLDNDDAISISFSEPVHKSTLALSGALAAESDGGTWSDDQTLVVSPVTSWKSGKDRPLAVAVEDHAGNPSAVTVFHYDIATVYVSVDDPAAGDANPGTRALPFARIQPAIAYAAGTFTDATVHIAEGTYAIDASDLADIIAMTDGVSLYGGYSSDWSGRDREAHASVVENSGGDFTVLANSLSTVPVLDGFVLRTTGSVGSLVSVIDCGMVASNNRLDASAANAATNYALSVTGSSSATIEDNEIIMGTGTVVFGIYLSGSSTASIRRNIIHGGNGSSGTVGIRLSETSTAQVCNNAVIPGTSTTCTAVYSTSSTPHVIVSNTLKGYLPVYLGQNAAVIENNILQATGTGYSIRAAETAAVMPASLRNNDAFGFSPYLARINTVRYSTWNEITLATAVDTAGSVVDEPVYENTATFDFRLTTTAPASLRGGGRDRSDLFSDDANGTARTIPWSIGAYERD